MVSYVLWKQNLKSEKPIKIQKIRNWQIEHADVALKAPRLSYQPVQFICILLLLDLQLRYLSVAGTKKERKHFYIYNI